jgi:hypothetical protein
MRRRSAIPADKYRPNQLPDIRISEREYPQSDWLIEVDTDPRYIKNKPVIPDVAAEQVQSDWDVADSSLPSFIKNKPSLADVIIFEDIPSTVIAGGINPGDVVLEGTTLTNFVKQLLITTLYPNLVSPSATRTSSPAHNTAYEAGSTVSWQLGVSFDRGHIMGALVEGIWDAGTSQNPRAGEAEYYTIDGVNMGETSTRTIDQLIADGNNTRTASVTHLEGPQPTDSDGEDYGSPLAAGTLSISSGVLRGQRKWFGGGQITSNLTSAGIRALEDSGLNPTTSGVYEIQVAQDSTIAVIAFESSKGEIDYIEQFGQGIVIDVTEVWEYHGLVSVEGANGYAGVDYKVYTFVPDVPYPSLVRYRFKIK